MRTLRRARVLRSAAFVLPGLMSLALFLAVSILPFGLLALPAALILAGWSLTQAGERRVLGLIMRAHPAGLSERYTLAPVAHVLAAHGIPPVQHLLVAQGGGFEAKAMGAETLLVGRGMVQGLANGRCTPQQAAALIAHEIGIQRSRLTSSDPALLVLLFPYKLWLSVLVGLWQAVGTILPPWLRRVSLLIAFGSQAWLGATEDPRHLLVAALFALGYAAHALLTAWEKARMRIGDIVITHTTLAGEYADLLLCHHHDTATRDRAIWIRHHTHAPTVPWVPPAQAPVRS